MNQAASFQYDKISFFLLLKIRILLLYGWGWPNISAKYRFLKGQFQYVLQRRADAVSAYSYPPAVDQKGIKYFF